MLRSMTGYGKAVAELDNLRITIEIKSVNSRQIDINCRLPVLYNQKEPELRSICSNFIQRGKVYLGISRDMHGEESVHSINREVAERYYKELEALSKRINQEKSTDYLQIIMGMPEVMKAKDEELNGKEWKYLKSAVQDALETLEKYRREEGKNLEKDFRNRIQIIRGYLDEIEPHEQGRLATLKERFNKELQDFIDNKNIDENRFEQEVVYYMDKLDITEEKVRLKQHCDYFVEILESDVANGKKLNFISQEMGREINTLGSKANHAEIQKIVVNMKDELEKIKEQLANIL